MGAHSRERLKSIDFAVCTLKSIKIAQINKNERNQHIWCVQMKRAQVYFLPRLVFLNPRHISVRKVRKFSDMKNNIVVRILGC